MERNPLSKPEITPLDADVFADLTDLINNYIEENSEPLPGMEAEDGLHATTGLRREVILPKGKAVIARYDPIERDHMELILQEQGVDISDPFGHIELLVDKPEASFETILYISNQRQIVGETHSSVVSDNAKLLDDSRDCFEYAEFLGLQQVWASLLFSEVDSLHQSLRLTERQVIDLTEALRHGR